MIKFIIIFLLVFIFLLLVLLVMKISFDIYKNLRVKKFYNENISNINTDIVLLGDSLTDFFKVEEYFKVKVINRGIAGNRTIDVSKRVNEILRLSPKVIFLQIGINDMIFKKKVTPEILSERISSIINVFLEKNIMVKLISLYPVNKKQMKILKIVYKNVNNEKINRVNELLKKIASEKKIEYIDIHKELLDNGELKKDYTTEGLHISKVGYDIIYSVLKNHIEEEKCI